MDAIDSRAARESTIGSSIETSPNRTARNQPFQITIKEWRERRSEAEGETRGRHKFHFRYWVVVLTGAPSRLLPLLLLKQCQPACSNKSYVYRYIIGFKPRFTLVLRRFEQNASTTETKCSTSLSPPEDSAESSGASLWSLSLVSLVSGRFRALQSLSLVSVVSVRADAMGVPLEKEPVPV
jgi:hypothetical protein